MEDEGEEACFMGVMESNERGGTSTEGQELRGLPYMRSAKKREGVGKHPNFVDNSK